MCEACIAEEGSPPFGTRSAMASSMYSMQHAESHPFPLSLFSLSLSSIGKALLFSISTFKRGEEEAARYGKTNLPFLTLREKGEGGYSPGSSNLST